MEPKAILHSDINHCYAQIEEMMHPELREVPMAVGGHEETRHGIILTRNDKAKEYGITTAESLREARAKCWDLVIIPPHYEEYIYYTERVKDIYREYSSSVESFGLDEAWVDLTHSQNLYGDAETIAHTIQNRVLKEIGLTVSMGLSYNKVFAKIGSDLIKPFGFTVITPQNYKEILYPLPVEDLFYVGRQTLKKLQHRGISTIGTLASLSPQYLTNFLGKMGEVLWYFANGLDVTEVAPNTYHEDPKSVGNGFTTVKDIQDFREACLVFSVLSESVASRLRDAGLKGRVIRIGLRNSKLEWFGRQRKNTRATDVAEEIMETVKDLLNENYDFSVPLRALAVQVSCLEPADNPAQLDLFTSEKNHDRARKLEVAMDEVRSRYGFNCIKKCGIIEQEELTAFNPKGDNTIHPVGFF